MVPAPSNSSAVVRATTEHKLGIIHHVSAVDFGWHGDIRKRFTDFIVNEVRKDGSVLHLSNYEVAEDTRKLGTPQTVNTETANQPPADQSSDLQVAPISPEDAAILERLLGESVASELTELYNRTARGESVNSNASNKITFPPITDKAERGSVHREVRRIFSGQIETETEESGSITATARLRTNRRARGGRQAGGNRNTRGGRGAARDFSEMGGDYLHFTLYKENKDTMEVLNQIARGLKGRASDFHFAGTKDRRAATTQRVCVHRVHKESLDRLNYRAQGYKVGDYKYQPYSINLGDHGGNEFVIVVKDCTLRRSQGCSVERKLQMLQQSVSLGLASIRENGFINYFGLQRFGTHTIGTQEVGMMILTEDFERAVDALLYVDPDVAAHALSENEDQSGFNRDEVARARAISEWKLGGNPVAALKQMPRRFSAESTVIHHLGKNDSSRRDFCGAILSITRGMRMLYIHAYQSCIWNYAASKRWERYGNRVVKGDLVLTNTNSSDDLTEDDEEISGAGSTESSHDRARALTSEEAKSGKYTIFDIVLPLPGFDVVYPDNDIGIYYVELMGMPEHGSLDPFNMRRRQREFSLSGGYRKLMARLVGESAGEARAFRDDNEQMYPTDLDIIEDRKAIEKAQDPTAKALSNPCMLDQQHRQREGDKDSQPAPRSSDTWVEKTSQGTTKRLKLAHDSPSNGNSNGASHYLNGSQVFGALPTQGASQESVNPGLDPTVTALSTRAAGKQPAREPVVATPPFDWPCTVPGPIEEQNEGWRAFCVGTLGVDSPFLRELGRFTMEQAAVASLAQPQADQLQVTYPPGDPAFQEMCMGMGQAPISQAASLRTSPAQGSANLRPEPELPPLPPVGQAQDVHLPSILPSGAEAAGADQPVYHRAASKRTGISAAPKVSELTEDMKLAVVLKFQLRASNYATIFLRELMGTMDPDFSIEFPASPV